LLPSHLITGIFNSLETCFDLVSKPEISLEANPGTLSLAFLNDLRAIGFNRISLGMQSANPQELALLDRNHNYDEVIDAVGWIRQAGIDNLNLDLIFGLPDQSIESWQRSMTAGLDLDPEHFSLYALTIEPGTLMYTLVERGLISQPDPDSAAAMYEAADLTLTKAGYVQYEISNWAKMGGVGQTQENNPDQFAPTITPSWACKHNLQYWRNQPYFGFGAGAHGYAGGFRISNVRPPREYIQRLANQHTRLKFPCTPATAEIQPIDRNTEMGETMIMGLRLTIEGVSRQKFQTQFQEDLFETYGPQINKNMELGLLTLDGPDKDILRLTNRGRLLGNRVFREFI
jgi:oxygen-independent coproporphyrinogen-3 oxidase